MDAPGIEDKINQVILENDCGYISLLFASFVLVALLTIMTPSKVCVLETVSPTGSVASCSFRILV